MLFNSVIKKGTFETFVGKWMDIETIMLSEIIQTPRINVLRFLLYNTLKIEII